MGTIAFGHVLVSPSDPSMQRLSIARSLRLALLALTLVLAAVAAAGAASMIAARQRYEDAGADLFLTKPFSPLDLLRLVDRLSGQSRPT
jgi:CheY-like chemotaxis protein